MNMLELMMQEDKFRNATENVIENVTENVVENSADVLKRDIRKLMPEYTEKKVEKACEILNLISKNPRITTGELGTNLGVNSRTIARYISELKANGIITREGPDNGGEWKILKNDLRIHLQA